MKKGVDEQLFDRFMELPPEERKLLIFMISKAEENKANGGDPSTAKFNLYEVLDLFGLENNMDNRIKVMDILHSLSNRSFSIEGLTSKDMDEYIREKKRRI